MHDFTGDGEAVLAVREIDDADLLLGIDDRVALEGTVVAPVPEGLALRGFLNADPESPEYRSGQLLWSAIGAIRAFRIDGHVRLLHFAESRGPQALAVENRAEKGGVIARCGVETGGGIGFFRFVLLLGFPIGVVAVGSACVVVVAPKVAAAGHPEWSENRFGHVVVEWLGSDLLNDFLEVDKTLAGVAEALTGREVNLQASIVAPVAKAGAMTEH